MKKNEVAKWMFASRDASNMNAKRCHVCHLPFHLFFFSFSFILEIEATFSLAIICARWMCAHSDRRWWHYTMPNNLTILCKVNVTNWKFHFNRIRESKFNSFSIVFCIFRRSYFSLICQYSFIGAGVYMLPTSSRAGTKNIKFIARIHSMFFLSAYGIFRSNFVWLCERKVVSLIQMFRSDMWNSSSIFAFCGKYQRAPKVFVAHSFTLPAGKILYENIDFYFNEFRCFFFFHFILCRFLHFECSVLLFETRVCVRVSARNEKKFTRMNVIPFTYATFSHFGDKWICKKICIDTKI